MIKFSIITVVFNDKDGLQRTIESVVNQDYKNIEYIIIDGGSNDGSVNVIEEYKDRITYWVSEPDKGIYNAMNKGIKIATGDYCNFMNAGDTFADFHVLSRICNFNCNSDVLCGFTNKGIWQQNEFVVDQQIRSPIKIDGRTLIMHSICHQSSFIKTNLLKNNPYNEQLRICSDRQFFIEELLLKNRSYQQLPFVVSNFDNTGLSSSKNISKVITERDAVVKLVFPKRIADDYLNYIEGRTDLEKLLNTASPRVYHLLTAVCKVIMLIISTLKKLAIYKNDR